MKGSNQQAKHFQTERRTKKQLSGVSFPLEPMGKKKMKEIPFEGTRLTFLTKVISKIQFLASPDALEVIVVSY